MLSTMIVYFTCDPMCYSVIISEIIIFLFIPSLLPNIGSSVIKLPIIIITDYTITDHIITESRVESRRSLRVKADDPQKDQSRRSRSKADDPWAKADDPSQSRRSSSKRRFYRVKSDDPWAKADDP